MRLMKVRERWLEEVLSEQMEPWTWVARDYLIEPTRYSPELPTLRAVRHSLLQPAEVQLFLSSSSQTIKANNSNSSNKGLHCYSRNIVPVSPSSFTHLGPALVIPARVCLLSRYS